MLLVKTQLLAKCSKASENKETCAGGEQVNTVRIRKLYAQWVINGNSLHKEELVF